jgi:transposase
MARTKYQTPQTARRYEIAKAVVANPNRMVKQIASDFGVSAATVYSCIKEYVTVTYTLRAPTEAQEKPKDGELPQ